MSVFDDLESEVRSYSRGWPVVFDRASGSRLYAENGRPYLDFFAGAGSLNYGHNNPVLKQALIDYLQRDGVTQTLDMFSTAKRDLLETFAEKILRPRELDYKVMFPGPGGANAVEAAMKLARKVTRKQSIIHFTNAFHGMTLGALSVSGNAFNRLSAGIPLPHTISVPYEGDTGPGSQHFERLAGRGDHRNRAGRRRDQHRERRLAA